ncbi:uncharacterized protein TNCV_3044891 [Trichonephila clavipes]|nr:uncharacterized protein TNCV_3044891 [Trichonephila clavipes]
MHLGAIGLNGDGNGDTIGTWCKKINVAGQAYCVFCNSLLKYGAEGFKAFTNHSKTVTHIKYSKCIRHSMTLSNYANSKNTDDLLETDARPLDIVTRKARQELSRDQTALNSLEMSRTTACYKMKYGLTKTIRENIIKTLKETPFSLNLDESTSNAQESILAILVQFYDNNQNEVAVHHFASLKMESCNSEAVFKAVVNTIEDNNIPWANLISVLMVKLLGCIKSIEYYMLNISNSRYLNLTCFKDSVFAASQDDQVPMEEFFCA